MVCYKRSHPPVDWRSVAQVKRSKRDPYHLASFFFLNSVQTFSVLVFGFFGGDFKFLFGFCCLFFFGWKLKKKKNKMGGSGIPQQQYCLRWNQHRSNLLGAFDQLLQTEALTDVTLSCGGASIKCHRIILAACSGYFQSLFVNDSVYLASPQQHPIVVFKDIQLSELKAILEFIYRGEVSVAQEQVGALLKAAESLKVKGLYSEDGAGSPAGLSGLSFEPISGHTADSGFLPQLRTSTQTTAPVQPPPAQHLPASLLQMPLFKRSPAKTPERTNSSLDKERDGSSSSETNPPEDDRDEPMVTDRMKSSRSPVFDHVKDLAPASSLSSYHGENGKNNGNSNRPELKRYRQYTRHDIAAAIEAVRSGQSALQASRLYGVPSRTLYDKVKKLGIVTGRPYRQSIAVAVSLAQGGNLSSVSAGSPGSRVNGGVGGNAVDDDSMDVHHHLHHHSNGHFRRLPNSLEELSLYFAASPAAAAAAAAELALSQHVHAAQTARGAVIPPSTTDEDDNNSNGAVIHPAPIDLSQNYERMMRIAGGDVDQTQTRDVVAVDTSNKTTELMVEKSA
ncbi:Bric-a-brac [Daphnia magna]|uniref:Bric-a-brac n=2 Tax=Daphnia magna TaxID=35525 RepID=A0A164UDN1_9CRUS|nr:Bric-a-brac [Daphnia magna]